MTGHDAEINVTLLLNGGHSRTLYLRRKDPLLTSLVSSLSEKSYGGGRAARPFNIRLDEGRRSFLFSSTDLVGLITDPPLPSASSTQQPATPPELQVSLESSTVEKSPYLLLDDFIDVGRHAELLKFVLEREAQFTPATLAEAQERGRSALTLRQFPEFSAIFRDRVRSLLPQLSVAFGIGEFPAREIECQLAAHNDGHYHGLHLDNTAPGTSDRTISYVFYFHNEPKAFSGGQFRLYNNRIGNGRFECGEPAAEFEPKNNSILFFPSHCPHEVLPVHCPSNRFADSRFTVNGWVRRAVGVP